MPHLRKHHLSRQQGLHRSSQRGAMGLLGVLTLVLAFTFAALALDTGRLWVARQDLQHAADMAALAAARHNGCGTSLEEARERAATSAKQFGVDVAQAGVTLTVTRGTLTKAVVGGANSQVFIPGAEPSDITTAAKVLLKKTVPKSLLMGGFVGQTIELSAVATAQGEAPKATLSVGTRFGITQKQADFISKLFSGILGNSSLNLTPGSLNNLATSVVNLEALRIAAGVATLNDLLTKQVTITELLGWISTAGTNIDASGQQALQSIISASTSKGNLKVRVGEILNVQTPAPDGVATANINVLDLVTVGLQVANKDALITLNAGLAGITSIKIKLLSLPKIAVGNKGKSAVTGAWCTRAKMAQMDVLIGLDTSKLPKLDLLALKATAIADLALHLRAGGVDAHLVDLVADSGGGQAQLETLSSLINIDLSNNAGTGPARVAVSLEVLGLPIKLDLKAGLSLPAQESKGKVMTVNVPAPVRTNLPQRTDRGTDLGDTLSTALKGSKLTLEVDGLLPVLKETLNTVLDWLTLVLKGLIDGLVTPLLTNIVVPLLDLLGFGVNGVSVELTDVVAPPPQLKI